MKALAHYCTFSFRKTPFGKALLFANSPSSLTTGETQIVQVPKTAPDSQFPTIPPQLSCSTYEVFFVGRHQQPNIAVREFPVFMQ